jgi:MFS family permease
VEVLHRDVPIDEARHDIYQSHAGVSVLRMLGLFMIMVFSIYAKTIPRRRQRLLVSIALGSFVAAGADDMTWIIVGRVIQGMGAVSESFTTLNCCA